LSNGSPYAIGPSSCPVLSDLPRLSVLSATLVYSGQTVGRIKTKLGTRVASALARWGPGSPSPKGAQPPIVGPYLLSQKWLDGPRCHSVERYVSAQTTLCYISTQLPSPKRGERPQFSAHVDCGQTAGWIKMPLGMEIGLSLGACVRWDAALPPKQRAAQPLFRHVYCGQTAGWLMMPLGTEVGLGQGDFVLDGEPAPP